jgi:hypothetical protein
MNNKLFIHNMMLKYNIPYHCLFIDCDTGGLGFSLTRKQTNGRCGGSIHIWRISSPKPLHLSYTTRTPNSGMHECWCTVYTDVTNSVTHNVHCNISRVQELLLYIFWEPHTFRFMEYDSHGPLVIICSSMNSSKTSSQILFIYCFQLHMPWKNMGPMILVV